MRLNKGLVAAAALACGITGLAAPASARVVCNRDGDCWSSHATYAYPRGWGMRYYSDRYADQAYRDRMWRRYHRTWHDEPHDMDRGAWRGGVWTPF